MADRPADSTADENRDVLFQSAYGDISKVVLYGNHIRWNDLKATLWSGQISGIDIYEVTCFDQLHGTKTMIASNLFRDFDDFATFALIVGEQISEDWSMKGFLPGKIRGDHKLARRAAGRIQAREDS